LKCFDQKILFLLQNKRCRNLCQKIKIFSKTNLLLFWQHLGDRLKILKTIVAILTVFQTEFGFHFLEVLEKRNHDMTDKLIEDRAYQLLYARKYEEELEGTLRSMRAEAFVEIKDLD
jgi:hypothetical protein